MVEIFQFPLTGRPLLHRVLNSASQRVLQPGPGIRQQPGQHRQSAQLGEEHAGQEQDARPGLHEVRGEEFRLRQFPGQWSSAYLHYETQLEVLCHS